MRRRTDGVTEGRSLCQVRIDGVLLSLETAAIVEAKYGLGKFAWKMSTSLLSICLGKIVNGTP